MYPCHALSKPVFCYFFYFSMIVTMVFCYFLLLDDCDFIVVGNFFLGDQGKMGVKLRGPLLLWISKVWSIIKKIIVGLSSCSLCNRKFQIHSSWRRSGCCTNSCLHHSCCNISIITWRGNRPAWRPRLLSNSERSFGPGKRDNNIYVWETGS